MNNIKVRITCRRPKSFLKELINRNIYLYDIKVTNNYLDIIINENDLIEIDKIEYIHKVKIINYYGLKKIKYLIIKYKIIILYIILGLLINILLSKIIFSIEVDTPNKELKKVILKDLQDNNIKLYHLKLTYKRKELAKANILSKENDKIEWLEIEDHGTKYIIKVEERKINDKEEICNPRNIISKKNAVITKIESREGEIVKKVNDYAEKNEVLISGLIHNNEKIVSKECAIGKVYGEVWYKVKLVFPNTYNKRVKTNNYSYGISLLFFNKTININDKYKYFEKNEYNIIDSKVIPIKIGFTRYNELKNKEYKYDIKKIDEYALSLAEEKIIKTIHNENITSKKVLKKESKNSKIIVEVFFGVEEDITTYQDISNIDIEKMNEERE